MKLLVFDETVGINWDGCPLVERVAGRVSGVPTLRNSRLPADAVVGNSDAGATAAEIADMYEVAVETVQSVLDYASKYRAIDR